MRSTFLERYLQGTSLVHRLDARLKLLATLSFVLTTTVTPPRTWYAFALLSALALTAVLASRIPPLDALKRSSIALPFAGMVALSLPFTSTGETLWVYRLFGWTLSITDEGLWSSVSLLVKAWVSVLVSGLLVATTPFTELLKGMRALHIPDVLITIISFTYRYLYVLTDEAMRLQTARDARSAGSGGTVLWRAKVLGGMIGSLFIRSYERSERIYQAMLSRGYVGKMLTMTQLTWRARDVWVSIVWSAALATVLVLGLVTA